MHRGYVKFWRCSVENKMYFSQPFTDWQAWQDIILETKWQPTTINIRGIRLEVDRGNCSQSEVQLAKRWKWSRGKVLRFLRFLAQQNMIEIVQQKNRLTTIIKIINYELYQSNDTTENIEIEQQTDIKRTSNGTTIKNIKNIKNYKNKEKRTLAHSEMSDSFVSFWKEYPKKTGKAAAMKAWSKLAPSADLITDIMAALQKHKEMEQWTKDDGQYIPHPATWLNGRRWEDEITVSGDWTMTDEEVLEMQRKIAAKKQEAAKTPLLPIARKGGLSGEVYSRNDLTSEHHAMISKYPGGGKNVIA